MAARYGRRLRPTTDKLVDLILATNDDGRPKQGYQAEGAEQKRLEAELAEMDQPHVAIDLHPAARNTMTEPITSVRDILQHG